VLSLAHLSLLRLKNEEQAIEKALDETDGYAEAEFSDWSFEGHEAEEIKQTEGDDD
jgi:hypothetical protein